MLFSRQRKIIDNLLSGETKAGLSANQGNVLNALIGVLAGDLAALDFADVGAASAGHDHVTASLVTNGYWVCDDSGLVLMWSGPIFFASFATKNWNYPIALSQDAFHVSAGYSSVTGPWPRISTIGSTSANIYNTLGGNRDIGFFGVGVI